MHVSSRAFQTLTRAKQHIGLRKLPHIGSVERGTRRWGSETAYAPKCRYQIIQAPPCNPESYQGDRHSIFFRRGKGAYFQVYFRLIKMMTQQHDSGSGGARKPQTAGKTLDYIWDLVAYPF